MFLLLFSRSWKTQRRVRTRHVRLLSVGERGVYKYSCTMAAYWRTVLQIEGESDAWWLVKRLVHRKPAATAVRIRPWLWKPRIWPRAEGSSESEAFQADFQRPGWLRSTVGRTPVFGRWTDPFLRSACSRRVTIMWVNRPLQVSQLGQLSLSSFRGRPVYRMCAQVAPSAEYLRGHGRVAVVLRRLWQHSPVLGLVVLACVPVCAVLRGSLLCSSFGLSAVEINENCY